MIEPLSNELVDPVFELMKQNMLSYYVRRGEEWNEHKIREYFLAQEGIVITKSGQVIGFSFYELKGKLIHIHTLQIASIYQNRTLGGRFLKWYRDLASKVGTEVITCGVYESNAARYMYQRVGFKEIGLVNGVVRMALPLTNTGLGLVVSRQP
ncbi:GNAT family N-acetyltransferase [Gilvimarinus polysaccharolyticus]|uniref:GNAT family N-acetyltransferase n=1 Tax=Gilvimarinus polysaccharolyticus TaxID=863921 RepID=UPI0018DDAFCF|nr:GNAT family N-acetyltransferase [Gilvimarinus polysaccharolyticus]